MRRNRWRRRLGATPPPPARLELAPPPAVSDELHREALAAAAQRAVVATMPTGLLVGELERRAGKLALTGQMPPVDRVRLVRLLDQALMLLGERERTCHRCGCTAERACAGGCTWVGADLCSSCRPTDAVAAVREAIAEVRTLSERLDAALAASEQAGG